MKHSRRHTEPPRSYVLPVLTGVVVGLVTLIVGTGMGWFR